MKSKTFKEFFKNFKEQSTCLICGKPLYIKKIDYEATHMIKGCSNHQFHYLSSSVNIKKTVLCFNKEGQLFYIDKVQISPIDISEITTPYNEQSFEMFIQNWKILS